MKKILFSLLLTTSGLWCLGAQELTTFGGYHTQLFGYKDQRYLDTSDQGDYLKTLSLYAGTEFVQKGIKTDDPGSMNIVLGAGVLLAVQNGFEPRELYQVTNSANVVVVKAETIASNPTDKAAKFQLNGSLFGGYTSEWWGAEGGLSVFIKGQEEKVRLKRDANNNTVEGVGRGWVFGDGSLVLPNLRLRLGSEGLPHFVASLYRGHYDPGYGAFQARVVLPFDKAFTLQVGGSLFQTSSIFVEPMVGLGNYTVSVRAGTILNYNDPAFTRVGIFEGAFVSGSVGVRW